MDDYDIWKLDNEYDEDSLCESCENYVSNDNTRIIEESYYCRKCYEDIMYSSGVKYKYLKNKLNDMYSYILKSEIPDEYSSPILQSINDIQEQIDSTWEKINE